MKYAIEMGSGAMIYIASLIMTGSGYQKSYLKTDLHIFTHHTVVVIAATRNTVILPCTGAITVQASKICDCIMV
jgi:hypothetical protein